jgi:hypothetical protein
MLKMRATLTPGQPEAGHRVTVKAEYAGKPLVHTDPANLEPADAPRRLP